MTQIYINKKIIEEIARTALKEDIGPKDVTTSVTVPKGLKIRAHIISNQNGIICGLPICETIFNILDNETRFKPQLEDGDAISEGKVIAYLEGEARHILSGERVALNFLSRLSGIATKTKGFVDLVSGLSVKIMDTRKTTPLLRYLERYAVRVGGGYNHRNGLWDQVLIKDNHIKVLDPKLKLQDLVKDIQKVIQKNLKVEIEVKTLKEFEDALMGKPDIIMLDNMSVYDARLAVLARNRLGKYPFIEVSGNITIENVLAYAKSGVDVISIGSLTHSFNSIDLSLEVDATI